MRRSLLGLLTVVAITGLVLTSGCQRATELRVLSMNKGNLLRSDIADYYQYFDKVDSETVTLSEYPSDSVPVELQYMEIGAGLPTWTPYVALLNKATIKYVGTTEAGYQYAPVNIPLSQSITADKTGKPVTFYVTVASPNFKDTYFSDAVSGDPNDIGLLDLVTATVTFSGYDSVAATQVSAVGLLQIQFGNFYDDPTKFGK
ncbi:MAG TPA: hypothetical protein VMH22_11420 [bacterium]|nr:hypothetical protein [bacterium]